MTSISYTGRRVAPREVSYVRQNINHRTTRHRKAAKSYDLTTILSIILAILTFITICVALGKAFRKIERPAADTAAYSASTLKMMMDMEDFPPIQATSQPQITPVETAVVEEIEEDAIEPVTTTRLGVTVNGYNNDVDYTAAINQTYDMISDDPSNAEHLLSLCEIYETQRNMKIEDNGLDFEKTNVFSAENSYEEIDAIRNPHVAYYDYTEDDLIYLARIINAEAGSYWCSDEHQQAVASVVMNRRSSSKFPNTVYDVIHAEGQYPNTCNSTSYTERSLENARQVLEYGPTVKGVWQANFVQGTQIEKVFSYPGHSTTYICI